MSDDSLLAVMPSGEQHVLESGAQRVVVVEVGGALRAYEADGIALIDGYGRGEPCTGARGQTLIPWPNRLADGRYEFAGEEHQLPLSEPSKHNAIHGLVRWANFVRRTGSADAVAMTHTLHPCPGYPFTLEVTIAYALGEGGLSVTTSARNVGDRSAPYGAGAHPYLRVRMPTIDDAALQAPGRTRLITDERGIPVGREPAGGALDFRAPRRIGVTQLDTAYTDLERGPDGRAWVHLEEPGGRRVSLWLDAAYPYLMLFSGDSLEDPAHRRTGLGVEPMTCPPNAFQTGEDLVRLGPGETHTATWGITAASA